MVNTTVTPKWGLPDLTEVDLKTIMRGDNPHLRVAASRVVAAVNDPDGIISAFQSFTQQQ